MLALLTLLEESHVRPSADNTASFIPFFSTDGEGEVPETWLSNRGGHVAVSKPADTFVLASSASKCLWLTLSSSSSPHEAEPYAAGIASSIPLSSTEGKGVEPVDGLGDDG